MAKISSYPAVSNLQDTDQFIIARESTTENFSMTVQALREKAFANSPSGTRSYILGLDNSGRVVKFLETSLRDDLIQNAILTDGASVVWDMASKVVSTALLDTNRTALTLSIQNMSEGSFHSLFVRKQSADPLVISTASQIYKVGESNSGGTITLTGSANELFKIEFNKVAGSVGVAVNVESQGSEVTGVTDGDKGDITVSSAGTIWTIDSNAVTNSKILSVSWAKVTDRPTTLSGYGITDAQSLSANLTSLASLNYTTPAFVKMTAAGTFVLDTSGGALTLQQVTSAGNQTNVPIILNSPDGTKSFEIKVLNNGNILFTGGNGFGLHCTGDIVAFSDGTGGGTGGGSSSGPGHVIARLLTPFAQREVLSFGSTFTVTDDAANNATLIGIDLSSITVLPSQITGLNLQAVTDGGNVTNDPIVLTNTAGTKQVSVSVDANGNVIFSAGLNQNFHFTGDVVAFSGLTPPAANWWDNMPYATDTTVGGIKVGSGLTITNGVLSVSGGVSAIWGNITGTLSNQTDLQNALNAKANASHTHGIGDITNLQSELDGKEPDILPGTTSQYWRGDKSWQTLNLQAVTDGGNTTNDPIILTNTAGTKQVSVSVDSNGNILFSAGLNQDFHFTGDVIAFSSLTPPASNWWELMPYATATTVGGIKVGSGLSIDGNGVLSATGAGLGSVTSVALSAPTGFSVSGSPVTSSGTLSLSFASGYSLPTNASQTNWDTAYGWGNHASAGYQLTSQKGVANGYASLDAGGKVPVSQLPSSLMEYKGVWNASTNSPSLIDGTGDTGDVYRVSVAGSQNLGSGSISFEVGDYVIYNGTTWEKSDTTDAVASVNGLTGVVVLSTSNIGEGTNLYFTEARVRSTPLTGYVVGSNTALAATDTVLGAFQKVQGQLNAKASSTHTHSVSEVTGLQAILDSKEPTITAGTTSQYWRGDKSWQTLNTTAVTEGTNLYFTESRVRSTPLTGYSVGTNTALAATDTVLGAFQKVQGQLNGKEATIVAGTSAQYWRGDKTWATLDTTAVVEGNNLYFTNTRSRTAISLTVSGSSGSATYNSLTGVFNIPTYTLSGLGGEPAITAGTTSQYWRGDKTFQTLNLQAVTDGGNTTNDPIVLTNAAGTKSVTISVDTNGNILFNAGLDQNFHFTGDVVAFSSMSPPATSWWDNMPYATATTVGGIKVGANLSIDANGVLSATSGGGGSVTSVALSLPSIFSVTGSPVTSTGTLTATLNTQSANLVFAGPTTGSAAPTFRSLVASDIPALSYEPVITAGTTSQYWRGDKSWQTLNTTAVTEGTNLYYTDARVRSAVLTGYTVGTNTALAATDTVLGAFQKVQGQLNAKASSSHTHSISEVTGLQAALDAKQSALNGTGFVRMSGTTVSYISGTSSQFVKADGSLDSTTYITGNQSITISGDASGGGTTAISVTNTGLRGVALPALGASAGFLRYTGTGTNTWVFDTNTYLTGNQSITISGDASGSGTTSISLTLANSGVSAGTYNNSSTAITPFTVDAKGRVTAVGSAVTITPAWSSITSKPTTISGFGITDAYTKSEVDSLLQGLDPKASVKAATTAAISLSGAQTIDGVSVVAGDRVLVKDQASAFDNGIYVVASGSWTRATDADSSSELISAFTFVEQGTINADTAWVCTNNGPISLGSTNITFVQFAGSGAYQARLNGTGFVRMSGTTVSYISGTSSQFVKADGSLDSSVYATTSSLGSYLPLAGGTMTGDITWTQTDRGLVWSMNTDGAYIKFFNTGDGDTNSRLEYATSDNGDEYHRFVIASIEKFSIKDDGARVSGNLVLHAGNYNSYSPTLTGGGASGTWSINVTGSAGSVPWSGVSSKPTTLSGYGITDSLYQAVTASLDVNATNATGLYRGSTSTWTNRPTVQHNGGALLQIETHPGGYYSQLFFDTGADRLYMRNANVGAWGSWLTILHSGNYNSYAPTLTGGGASGTWGISITGNSATTSQTNFASLSVGGNAVATQLWVQTQGYLTSYSETDTLASVTGRGATTTVNISANGVILGNDVTYGSPYKTVAFGNSGDGNNRILASTTTSDGMYFMAATGQGFNFRPNGGTANLVSIGTTGGLTAASFIKSGGTSSQFLKADGSVDSNSYYLASNPSGYTTNTGTVTSVSGTGTISGLTLSGTVTTSGSLTLGGTLSASIDNITDEHRLFNNMGDNHGTRTSFDATTPSYNFGWRYVQGSTNGPGVNSATQYYHLYVGLGNDYLATGAGSYGMQIAIPRNVTTPYIAIRYNENNSLAAWQKISAGYADSAGNSATTSQTNFSSLSIGGVSVATQGWVQSQGYLTSYTETDTLASVTGRGATTSTAVTLNGGLSSTSGSFSGNVTWSGSSSGNPRAIAIGYSGGNYGQIGYGIAFTGTSGAHNYAINDFVTRMDFYDGIQVYAAAAGSVGAAISWTEVLYMSRGGTFRYLGSNIWTAGNLTNLNQLTNGPGYITSASVGNGTLTMNVSGNGLSGSQTFTANQSTAATFTVTSNATNANTASTIVFRDSSGNFSAGTITATLSGTATTATNWGAYGAVPAAGTSFGNANTIGRSDANGYTYFNYINSNTTNGENPTIGQIIVTNGSDNFYRKASIGHLTSAVQSAASGTWSINITGSAGSASSATNALRIVYNDGPRNLSDRLPNSFTRTVNFDFVSSGTVGGTGNYAGVMTYNPWDGTTGSTGDSSYQLAFMNESGINGSGLPGLRIRKGIDTTWGSWYTLLHAGNYNSYSPTLTGTGASGTWGISVTGTASNVSGTVAVGNGGTGATSLTGILIGNGTSAVTALSSTSALQVLRVNLAGTGYEFASASVGITGGGTGGRIPKFDGTGAALVDSSISDNGTTVTLNQGQLQFPVTQNGSSDANTLDDYEEGTFTPSFNAISSTFSYASRQGYYTKIGNTVLVVIHIRLNTSGNTLAANTLTIVNLPFISRSATDYRAIADARWANISTSLIRVVSELGSGTNTLTLYKVTGVTTSVTTNMAATDLNATSASQISISFSYQV